MRFLRKLLAVSTILISIQAQGQEFPTPEANLPNLRGTCAPDNIEIFGLVPLDQPIATDKMDWAPVFDNVTPAYAKPDRHNNIRITVCEQADGTYRIQGIQHRLFYKNVDLNHTFNLRKDYTEMYWEYPGKGLDDALFGGPENLRLFTNAPQISPGIKIKGWKIDDQPFVTVSMLTQQAGEFSNLVGAVLIGKLEYGDPFAGETTLDCGPRGVGFTENAAFGTAFLELSGCGYQAAGNSMLKSLLQVRVTDTNEAIAPELRGKDVILKGDDLQNLSAYNSSHHNWCDSFYVRVPELNTVYLSAANVVDGFPLVNGLEFVGKAVQYGDSWNILSAVKKGSGLCY